MSGRVIVVGSVNVDLVVTTERLPAAGETVIGGRFARHHGGKGGNQAVAAARLGARTFFIGAVGDDAFGVEARAALAAEGVDVDGVLINPDEPTGVALILVDAAGENSIAVAGGANAALDSVEVRAALKRLALTRDDVVLVGPRDPDRRHPRGGSPRPDRRRDGDPQPGAGGGPVATDPRPRPHPDPERGRAGGPVWRRGQPVGPCQATARSGSRRPRGPGEPRAQGARSSSRAGGRARSRHRGSRSSTRSVPATRSMGRSRRVWRRVWVLPKPRRRAVVAARWRSPGRAHERGCRRQPSSTGHYRKAATRTSRPVLPRRPPPRPRS